MRRILVVGLLLLTSVYLYADNYYIAGDGNDNASGTNPDSPWKSINKLNEQKIRPGDTVFFRSGDRFEGTIKIKNSGKKDKPIVFTAYGDGPSPVLSGACALSGINREKENIYSLKTTEPIQHLFLNNNILMIARHPNAGHLIMEGGDKEYVLENEMPFKKDVMKGANIRIRTVNWQYETRKIDDIKENIIHLSSELHHAAKSNWGYYIDNKKEFLDADNEWFYDADNKKVYLYSKKPVNNDHQYYGSYIDHGVIVEKGVEHVTLNNLHFTRYLNTGVNLTSNNQYIHIENCKFSHIYKIAINLNLGNKHIIVKNNEIFDVYGRGVSALEATGCVIKNNTLNRIGLIPGYGIDGVNGGVGIIFSNREIKGKENRNTGHNNLISYNRIDSTGYVSIRMDGYNSVCEYNNVSYAVLTLNDGSMIYCWGIDTAFTYHNIIRHNIAQYAIGNTDGTPNDHKMNIGIYIDNNAHHIIVEDNIVRGAGSGIHINAGAYKNKINNNVLYGNKKALSFAQWGNGRFLTVCEDNYATNNIFFNNYNLHHTVSMKHTYKPEFDPGLLDSNIYVSPNEKYHIKKETMEDECKVTRNYTFKAWQENSDDDKDSEFIDLDFNTKTMLLVNDELEEKTFSLEDHLVYTTLKGEKIEGNEVTLQPYKGKILIYKLKKE